MKEYLFFLQNILESSETIEEARTKHIEMLRYEKELVSSAYATKLESCNKVHTKKYQDTLKEEWTKVKGNLERTFGSQGVKFEITSRIKDYVGLNKKILLYLKKGKSLDKIQDMMGIRIIIGEVIYDSQSTLKLCDEVMNEILKYFIIERECILTEAEPLVDYYLGFDKSLNIVIPKVNGLDPIFLPNIKDYNRFPKRNGYQSLHCVVKNTDGIPFEVQVRTRAMHLRAEYGIASHAPYKDKRYEDIANDIDFSNVHMKGFKIKRDGTVEDKIGLIKSTSPF